VCEQIPLERSRRKLVPNDARMCPRAVLAVTVQEEREDSMYRMIWKGEHAGSTEPEGTFHLNSLDRLDITDDVAEEEKVAKRVMDD
jgi:hypothetical protein